ncbi:hypothetical protein [Haladaptatus halobius]|uniref:hypothetical protein n=1 Tax=Haladaptatus halobius TaxID=2884875 RepID=UPI001D0A7411|nr:hypothetical protein [Haladaptatus halobius]
MNTYVILAGASLICFGFATIVSILITYTSPANPLGLLLLATALFVSAGLFGLFSLTWYLVQWIASVATTGVRKGRYQLGAWLEELEEKHSIIRIICLSTVIVPPDRRSPKERVTESLTALQARYIEGQITEPEFENELMTILELESEIEY